MHLPKPQRALDNKPNTPRYASPVWNLPATHFGNRWIVYSPKLLRLVVLYSDLEYDHWVLVESDPKIISYCEQPLRVRVRMPSGVVTTIFDMWVLFEDGTEEFREVKYRSRLKEPRSERQIKAQKLWCLKNKTPHKVFDECKVRASPLYLSNWKSILRILTASADLDLTEHQTAILSVLENNPYTLDQLEEMFPKVESALIRLAALRLLHSGEATAALHQQPLNRRLLIELPKVESGSSVISHVKKTDHDHNSSF